MGNEPKLLFSFCFSSLEPHGIGVRSSVELKSVLLAHGPCVEPVNLVIMARTKLSVRSSVDFVSTIIRSLDSSGFLKSERIRDIRFDRIKSQDEQVQVAIFKSDI